MENVVTAVCLALIMLLYKIYEPKLFKKRIPWIEYVLWGILSGFLTFFVIYRAGVLSSEYHLVDDHEIIRISNDINQNGFFRTVFYWCRNDLNIRFRPVYYFFRVLKTLFFGTDFYVWHTFAVVEAVVVYVLMYILLRKINCSTFFAALLSGMLFVGGSSAVIWRLGPQECEGLILLIVCFLIILKYKGDKKKYFWPLMIFTVLLALQKESFLISLPVLLIFLMGMELKETGGKISTKRIFEVIKKNAAYVIGNLTVLVLGIIIIIMFVGLLKMNYGGIDTNWKISDYYNAIKKVCTNDIKEYLIVFFLFQIGVIIYLIVNGLVKNGKILWSSFSELIFGTVVVICGVGFQVILYAKSGMFERYLFPSVIFVFLGLAMIMHTVENNKIFTSCCMLVFICLNCYFFDYFSLMRDAEEYALQGKTETAILSKTKEITKDGDKILAAFDLEGDFSFSVYMQEIYNKSDVYGINHNDLSDNFLYDQYLGDEYINKKGLSYSDIDVFAGFAANAYSVMVRNGVDINDFKCYELNDYRIYYR